MPKFSPAQKFQAALRALSGAADDMAAALADADAHARAAGRAVPGRKGTPKVSTSKKQAAAKTRAKARGTTPTRTKYKPMGRKPMPLPAQETMAVLTTLKAAGDGSIAKSLFSTGPKPLDEKVVTKILERGIAAKVIKKHGKARWTSYSLKTELAVAVKKLGLEPAAPKAARKVTSKVTPATAPDASPGATLAEVFSAEPASTQAEPVPMPMPETPPAEA